MNELIDRQAAIDALAEDMPQPYTPDGLHPADEGIFMAQEIYADCIQTLKELPSVQPEITDEQAIGHLQASGWMQSHDKQMYEMGLKEWLADDSDSYDALLPSSQPGINCSGIPNTSDFVSRKAVREMVATWAYDLMEQEDLNMALHDVDELPPAQPEIIHCKDCDLWHRTGCPINVFAERCDECQFCAGAERKDNKCPRCGYERNDVQTEENMQMIDLREEQEEKIVASPIIHPLKGE